MMKGIGMGVRKISPNLALDTQVSMRQAAGESIVHLGFGESRLPVFPPLAERLSAGADRNSYGPVPGYPGVLRALAGYFDRRSLPTQPEQCIVAPGSKPLLLALQMVIPGDVVLPAPCWVTYAPQALLAGKRVIEVPIPPECGGVPDPVGLRVAVQTARSLGANPRILVLTAPDNPTGTTATPELIRQLCKVAEDEDLIIISDEIYRDLIHDPGFTYLSPAEVVPHRTIVVTGLSKSLALGGWRIGAARFQADDTGERLLADVTSVASEMWSTLAGPMQEVAEYAFDEPAELVARRENDNRLHGILAREVQRLAIGAGALSRPPTGGFYIYPDFEPFREKLSRRGVVDGVTLQNHLLEQSGVAVLAGVHFGDDARALRFRAATSVLYGQTREQQQEAMDATDPLSVPHVADSLAMIDKAFTELSSD